LLLLSTYSTTLKNQYLMDRVPPQTHWQLLYWSFSVFRILLILLQSGSILFVNEIQGESTILIHWVFITFSILHNIQTRKTSSPVATASTVSSSSIPISAILC
jgi:hypothetical protein